MVIVDPAEDVAGMVGEGHAPVVAVLLEGRGKKADESITAPKGHGSPDPAAFPLQITIFGDRGRGHDRHRGPQGKPTAVMVGEGHAPAVAVLLSRRGSVLAHA
jgi:hypothetical protein